MKIGRNDPCPCGSGKKFKRCQCGWQEPVEPDAPSILDEEDPESSLEALNPENADVLSPAYWEKLSKVLPDDRRKELAPIIEEVKHNAEMQSRLPQIQAAEDALQPHRAEYEKLMQNTPDFIERGEKLFAEEPFAAMRFRAEDMQRAFESVGFATVVQTDKAFLAKMEKAIRFLLNDDQRRRLAQRLLLILPDYVAAGRFLDGWMIWHSADMMIEKRQRAPGPFLMALFMLGLREWEQQRKQDELAMFQELGLDPEEIRKAGYEGAAALVSELLKDPEKSAALGRFFAAHPRLGAMTQAQCRASERAALALLGRKEAGIVLLTPEEVEPWLKVLDERLGALPKEITSQLVSSVRPDRKGKDALADTVYGVAVEMGKAVLTSARLDRLESQLQELGRNLQSGGDKKALMGLHWALATLRRTPLEDNAFLSCLCWTSLRGVMKAMTSPAD